MNRSTTTGPPDSLQLTKNDIIKPPSKEFTGIDLYLTRVCATICSKLYAVSKIDQCVAAQRQTEAQFDFKTPGGKDVECILYEDHGDFKATNPPFAVVTMGETMILGWRGTNSLMDAITDLSISPVDLSRWSEVSRGVKAQGGFCSLVQTDLEQLHEARIIGAIKSRRIKDLIFTGHSLGGGLAQVAQCFVQSKLSQPGSRWNSIEGNLTCRTVAFSAPMSIIDVDKDTSPSLTDSERTSAKAFLEEISKTSCNIVYGNDLVPRAYGNVAYLKKSIEDMKMVGLLPTLNKVAKVERKVFSFDKDLTKVFEKFRHVGHIVYYAPDFHPAWTHGNLAKGIKPRRSVPQQLSCSEFAAFMTDDEAKYKKIHLTKAAYLRSHLVFPSALAYNISHEGIQKDFRRAGVEKPGDIDVKEDHLLFRVRDLNDPAQGDEGYSDWADHSYS